MDADVIMFLILIIVVLLAITVFGVLTYSGIFSFPSVRTGQPPINYNCTFAYQFLRGPYSSNDVGAAFTLATSIAPKAPSIGIFYDNPQTVPENDLRCAVGCLISREQVTTAEADTNEVVDDEPENTFIRPLIDEKEEELLKKKGFRFCQLPRVDLAVITEFPYTTPFSIWLAPNKVYPRLGEYIASKNLCAYPMIEVYAENQIRYMAPLSKQDDFFVPEAKESCDDEGSSSGEEAETAPTTEDKPGPSVTIVSQASVDTIQKVGDVVVESVEGRDDVSNVRRRRHLPQSEPGQETPISLPEMETGPAKRKDSTQSSGSSSFEQVGAEDL